jgi:hypothetical protein
MQVSWCHILPLMHLIQAACVQLLSQSFLLHTKQTVWSFALVRILELLDVLLGTLFLWRNNSSLAKLFLDCLHHIYPLCALWQCVHKRNADNIVWKRLCWRLVLNLRPWCGCIRMYNWTALKGTEGNWIELHWISDLFQFSSWERQFVVVRAASMEGGGVRCCNLPNKNLKNRFIRHDGVNYLTWFIRHLKADTEMG